MDGRVNVRAAVFGSAVAIRRVEITLVCVSMELNFQRERLGRRPVERVRRKIVREVNPLTFRKRWIGARTINDSDG